MHPLLIPEGSDGERALGRFKGYTFVFISIMSVVSTSFKMAWGGTIILFKFSFFFVFHSMWERRTKRLCMGVALF